MKLRMRLALTTVAVAIPVALCMAWLNTFSRIRATEANLSAFALLYMDEGGGRARCEASPESWSVGPPSRPPRERDSRGDISPEGGPRRRHSRPDGPPPSPEDWADWKGRDGPPESEGHDEGPGDGPPDRRARGRGPPPPGARGCSRMTPTSCRATPRPRAWTRRSCRSWARGGR